MWRDTADRLAWQAISMVDWIYSLERFQKIEVIEVHRFYVGQEIGSQSTVSISDAGQFHHLKDVLRLKAGDEVIVFDQSGNEYICSIAKLDRSKKEAVLAVKVKRQAQVKRARLTVACAIPKTAKMDEIIDSLTQLGVDGIIPMETERVIIKLDALKREARLKRWRKIAQGTAQQSQRNSIPLIEPVTDIESVLSRSGKFDLKLILTVAGERKHIKEVFAGCSAGNILVLIGPEGDFTPREVELAGNAGFISVSLGDSVLRVSTAAIAVASYIRFSVGD